MRYSSTRDNRSTASAAWAIAHGISVEGGLFVPDNIPESVSLLFIRFPPLCLCLPKSRLNDKFRMNICPNCVEYAY